VGCAILALSLWGLSFRRFVFGSAWIAVTLIIAYAVYWRRQFRLLSAASRQTNNSAAG
jgi:hypothetical protein